MVQKIKRLHKDKRSLQMENHSLKETITKLREGHHDIEIDGEVQNDVESVFRECRHVTGDVENKRRFKRDITGILARTSTTESEQV